MSAAVVLRAEDRPFGPWSLLDTGSLGGSGMLQSVPAQVASQVHVASLLHTCTDEKERNWTILKFLHSLMWDCEYRELQSHDKQKI